MNADELIRSLDPGAGWRLRRFPERREYLVVAWEVCDAEGDCPILHAARRKGISDPRTGAAYGRGEWGKAAERLGLPADEAWSLMRVADGPPLDRQGWPYAPFGAELARLRADLLARVNLREANEEHDPA